MKYNFDQVIDRRHSKYSYSMKWGTSSLVSDMVGVKEIKEDSLALFTADMDFKCAGPIIRAMHEVADHGIFGYSTQEDAKGYYKAISGWFDRHYGWKIKNEEMVYVNGSVEAIRQVIKAFTCEGDGVILQRPVYGPFTGAIEYMNRRVVNNSLVEKPGGYYEMDFDDLEDKARDPKNKLMLLCSPHNPVGRIWTKEELKRLSNICMRNQVILFADEIHGDLIRKDAVFYPMALAGEPSNLIAATAVNKTFNLAGLHATNLVVPNKALREKLKSSLPFILPSPFTIAATIAAYEEGEEWLDQVKDYIDNNIDFVISYMKEKVPKAKIRRPEGTYILWIDLRDYHLEPEEIHRRIYEKAGVLLEGGEMFCENLGKGFERICVPSPRAVLKEAIDRIAEVME